MFCQPEEGATASSDLPGSSVFALQDPHICGPGHYVEHIGMLFDSAAFGLAVAAFMSGKPATLKTFNRTFAMLLPV